MTLLDQHGRVLLAPARRGAVMAPRVRATYDAAQPGGPLQKHWSAADWFSPNAGANPNVRRQMRSRARYEVANNPYAAGIVSTLANYIVGTGPTLRMVPKDGLPPKAIKTLQALTDRFNEWAWQVELARTLHVMQRAKSTDGEGLAMLVGRSSVPDGQVTLGLRTFEAEMLTNPQDFMFYVMDKPEGIDLGPDGQPAAYWVLKHHPGGGMFQVYPTDAQRVPAPLVCHWFDELRPGLMRGIPEIGPALTMFAQLRRYTAAVVTAAETAADLAGVLQTDTPPGEEDEIDPGNLFELEKGQLITLPQGWKMNQMKAEHPGTMHETFIRCMIREIGRCIDMPYAVAAMDASGHNYSSMRGDWQAFFAALRWRRANCERQVLDKILAAWLQEAVLVYNVALPQEKFDFVWDWPSSEPIDAVKDAEADIMRLAANLTTYAKVYAKQGEDYLSALQQRAREEAMLKELGLQPAQVAPMVPKAGEETPPPAKEEAKAASPTRRRRVREDGDA